MGYGPVHPAAGRLVTRPGHPQRHRSPRARAHLPPTRAHQGPDRLWADGEEYLDTVALGWTGRNVYVRMKDPRYRLRAVWLDAADVKRR
jgi:hypothetical protein